MRPPICELCDERFGPAEGGLVYFADHKPLPRGMVGHPEGLGWFCARHHAAAEALSDLPMDEALDQLRKKHSLWDRLRWFVQKMTEARR